MQFLQAANYTPATHRDINLLVIHDMEYPERITAAEDVAKYFHNEPKNENGSSAHICVDENSAVQCVFDHDIAWAAPDANHDGWHCEFAGYSKQNRKDWHDEYDQKMIFQVAAPIFAHKSLRYNIPLHLLDASDLRRGRTGVTAHIFVTEAFGPVGGHTDPGTNFPYQEFLHEISSWKNHLSRRSH